MENTDNIYEVLKEEEGPDIKKIIFILLRQWHWFLLFGALGLGMAYAYTRLAKPTYSISGSILIPEKSNEMDMKDLFQSAMQGGPDNTKINNQIEILKSSFTIDQTLLNLNWRTSWYEKDLFNWKDIYKQKPFDVQELQQFTNPSGVRVYITPTSLNAYTVSVDEEIMLDGHLTKINFESKGAFGSPFKNKYFNFTLLKKINNSDTPDGEYYFIFNDRREKTLAYQKRLDASLKDEKSDIVLCTIKGEEPEKESDFLNELIKGRF